MKLLYYEGTRTSFTGTLQRERQRGPSLCLRCPPPRLRIAVISSLKICTGYYYIILYNFHGPVSIGRVFFVSSRSTLSSTSSSSLPTSFPSSSAAQFLLPAAFPVYFAISSSVISLSSVDVLKIKAMVIRIVLLIGRCCLGVGRGHVCRGHERHH